MPVSIKTTPPILLIIFNRPDKVRSLVKALSIVKPRQLYIMADGPRNEVPSDKERCAAARSIATDIPWDCEVHTKFLDENIGCDKAVPMGIDWFFDNVEEGIILEDDCIPNPSFFPFCSELLEKYRDNDQIMHISGNNFQDGIIRGDGSYYFSNYSHSWGWATWRKAWSSYRPAINKLNKEGPDKVVARLSLSKKAKRFWIKHLQNNKNWDGHWMYSIWQQSGLAILPNKNLVSNIGFDAEATHTRSSSHLANIQNEKIGHIRHPKNIMTDYEADEYTFKHIYYKKLTMRVINKIITVSKSCLK